MEKTEFTWYFSEIYNWNVSPNEALLRQLNQGDREALYSELRTYGKFTGLC